MEYVKFNKDFTVTGWPEGIPFKQPYDYGKNQIKFIMDSKDHIEFSAINRGNEVNSQGQSTTLYTQSRGNSCTRNASKDETVETG